jgi:glutathione S-transferase
MQIGADVYCDSRCIIDELECRFPEPTLYPNGERGLSEALTCWANGPMMMSVFGLYLGAETASVDPTYLNDRVAATDGLVNIAQMQAAVPHFLDQIRVHMNWVERQLGDGRSYLLGEHIGGADLTAYQQIWWLRQTYSKAEALIEPFRRVIVWMERVAGLGHGKRTDISAEEALAAAIAARPVSLATGARRTSGRWHSPSRACWASWELASG